MKLYGSFEKLIDIFDSFSVPEVNQKHIKVLFASYDRGDYDGQAGVLFLEKDKMYTVYGSHCSCYGLEGQWDPEEISFDEIKHYGVNKSNINGLNFETIYDYILSLIPDADKLTSKEVNMILRLSL